MRKIIMILMLLAVLCGSVTVVSATGIVHDPLNYATNLINNALQKAQHIIQIAEDAKRLLELKNLVSKFESFNQKLVDSGFGEIKGLIQKVRFLAGDRDGLLLPFKEESSNLYLEALNQNPFFQGTSSQLEQIDFLSNRADLGTSTLPYYLTLVPDPLSPNHKHITYEQAQIARAFEQVDVLREYSEELAKDGRDLEEAAAGANLLGATRLQASSMGKLYEAFGVLVNAVGSSTKMTAILAEQKSREEKESELARRKVSQDMAEFVFGSKVPVVEGGEL